MRPTPSSRAPGIVALISGFVVIFALALAIGIPGAGAQAGPAPHRAAAFVPVEDSQTPEASETWHPEATGTQQPEATETWHPEATETHQPEATETHQPEATETHQPEATGTWHPEGTETEPPEATETHQPEGTETPHPEATETAHPESTQTEPPEGTGTPGPEPSETAPSTPTGSPPGFVSIPGIGSRLFPETGRTVFGLFLSYWQAHGALPQQGYPISSLTREVSELNAKPYTVQYFERAVMEYHPENQAPYDVLLSQLGTFQYRQKYPNGAPGQQPNTAGGRYFAQTGHWVGGAFWAYWQAHGGLAQQGYPLSDQFVEASPLNGKSYIVQYFERAVFELHPENQAPYDVLLSQLGTFRYQQKYGH